MFIGESLHASSLDIQSPTTYYGAWFDTHGNGADFVCNVIAHRGLADPDGCKITVQTKNIEDSDDLAVDLVRIQGAGQAKIRVSGDPAWFHFRMLHTSWLTNEI